MFQQIKLAVINFLFNIFNLIDLIENLKII